MLDFRYRFVSILLTGLFVCALPTQARGPHIIAGWGTVTDPDGDCSVSVKGRKVAVTIPGTVHDISIMYAKKNAPHILRTVSGDFTVETKLSGAFDPGNISAKPHRQCFNGAGLLIWINARSYIRLERDIIVEPSGKRAFSYTPLFEFWENGKVHPHAHGNYKPFFTSRSTELKLTRRGNKIYVAVNADGVKWVYLAPAIAAFPQKMQVGIDAINTSKKPFTVVFEKFRVIQK